MSNDNTEQNKSLSEMSSAKTELTDEKLSKASGGSGHEQWIELTSWQWSVG
jgi:hypothetical protein